MIALIGAVGKRLFPLIVGAGGAGSDAIRVIFSVRRIAWWLSRDFYVRKF
jgi:hypothetical protein